MQATDSNSAKTLPHRIPQNVDHVLTSSHRRASRTGMKVRGIVLAALLLALVDSDPLRPRPTEPADEEGFGSLLHRYWLRAYTKVSEWMQSVSESPTGQYIRSALNGSSTALATYSKVVFDQIMHLM